MKKGIHILLSFFLTALIIYGGSGVNAYFFCCDDCRAEGPNAVVKHKCCEIHHHHHLGGLITHQEEHVCSPYVVEAHGTCGVDRIHFDWQPSSDDQVQLQPLTVDLTRLPFLVAGESGIAVNKLPEPHYPSKRGQKPPNLSKDDYFSLLTTLII